MAISSEMQVLIDKMRFRLDDLDPTNYEFDDSYLAGHIQNQLDVYDYFLPLDDKRNEQLIIIEALIDVSTALKMWADGESYSYKNDAIQLSRGLMSKHFQDTINLLKAERNELLEGNGGVY